MMLETLPPGVEHHEPADRRAEAFRIRGDPQQRLRGRPKQQVVDDALVGEREARQRLRHREDDVDVAHRQELGFPRRDPGVARGRQTPGTMPVPAAVVRERRLRTLLTPIAVPAERRGAALRDGAEHAPMRPVTHARWVSRKRSPCRRTMSSESLHGVEITANGRRREVPTLELLQHHLAAMGHKTPPVTPKLPRRSSEPHAQRPPRQRLGPNAAGILWHSRAESSTHRDDQIGNPARRPNALSSAQPA